MNFDCRVHIRGYASNKLSSQPNRSCTGQGALNDMPWSTTMISGKVFLQILGFAVGNKCSMETQINVKDILQAACEKD